MAKFFRSGSSKSAAKPQTRAAVPTHPSSSPQPSGVVGRPAARIESKPAAEPTPQAIAEAAYFLWLKRGGNETVNWLEAERMLRTKTAPQRV